MGYKSFQSKSSKDRYYFKIVLEPCILTLSKREEEAYILTESILDPGAVPG